MIASQDTLLRPRQDSAFDLVVIAASLGGTDAASRIFRELPVDFPIPIVLVQHLSRNGPSAAVPARLARAARLPVAFAKHGQRLQRGHIYVAPARHHFVLRGTRVCPLGFVVDGPPINYAQPSAEPTFASAAEHFGARTIAVFLSGRLSDGATGAALIQRRGGVVIAQDPATCLAQGMPRAVIDRGDATFVLSPSGIAATLVSLVACPARSTSR